MLLVVGDQHQLMGKSHGGDGYVGQTEGQAFLPPLAEQIAGEPGNLPRDRVEFETSQELLRLGLLAGAHAHVQFGDVDGATGQKDVLLACCAVNVTELYMGMRPGEEAKTEKFLRSLEFYPVTWEIARLAGDLFRQWRQKGLTLGLADVTIAAVALTHELVLVTDNQKHFPMPELRLLQLPDER